VTIWRKRTPEMLAKLVMGEISSDELDKKSVARMSRNDLITVIKPSAVTIHQLSNKRLVSICGSVDLSFSRSLRRLVELGLIEVLKEVSPGRHGYLYSLSKKGRAEAHKIRNQIFNMINEFQHLI